VLVYERPSFSGSLFQKDKNLSIVKATKNKERGVTWHLSSGAHEQHVVLCTLAVFAATTIVHEE